MKHRSFAVLFGSQGRIDPRRVLMKGISFNPRTADGKAPPKEAAPKKEEAAAPKK